VKHPESICGTTGLDNRADRLRQTEIALEAAIEETHKLIEELEELRSAAKVVVDAWHGRSSISQNLALTRLESQLQREKTKKL